jgi:hypothetical protein
MNESGVQRNQGRCAGKRTPFPTLSPHLECTPVVHTPVAGELPANQRLESGWGTSWFLRTRDAMRKCRMRIAPLCRAWPLGSPANVSNVGTDPGPTPFHIRVR